MDLQFEIGHFISLKLSANGSILWAGPVVFLRLIKPAIKNT